MSAVKKLDTGSDFSRLELGAWIAKEIERGAQETFGNMIGVKPVAGPYKLERECQVQGDISGIINVVQENISGTMIVSYPHETIFYILEKMFRTPITKVDNTVREGVGELTNIIYGVIKTNLNRTGYHFQMAIPTVVLGVQHVVTNFQSDSTMVVPFTIDNKPFYIMLTIHKQGGDKK